MYMYIELPHIPYGSKLSCDFFYLSIEILNIATKYTFDDIIVSKVSHLLFKVIYII